MLYSVGDAAFKHIVGVNEGYIHAFLTGGPLGISFDLRKVDKPVLDRLKEHIESFKKNREFWQTARCRVLTDTESLFVLQFHNKDMSQNVVQVFTKRHTQAGIKVYPVLCDAKMYTLPDGSKKSGKAISDEGVYIKINTLYDAPVIELKAE